jgi:hypothetical protein
MTNLWDQHLDAIALAILWYNEETGKEKYELDS